MEPSRLAEVLTGLRVDHDHRESPGQRLCDASVNLLVVDGAAIMLMGDHGNASSLGSSDETMRAVEDLQFTLGEGPGVEAHAVGRPALEPDLAARAVRWPTFAAGAVLAGVNAGFGFPLRVGAARLGALDLYCYRAATLGPEQIADAIVMAGIVTNAVLTLQAHARLGGLPRELNDLENLRAVVHQASGMISKQLEISIVDALVRLRAFAYAEGRAINEVARDVVARHLTIE